MATVADRPTTQSPKPDWSRRTPRERRPGTALVARGESMLWLTGGALAVSLFMIAGLVALIISMGTATFWPAPVVSLKLVDGKVRMGEVSRTESFSLTPELVARLPEATAVPAAALLGTRESVPASRRLLRTGNFDLTGTHYESVSDFEVAPGGESLPQWAVVVERLEWGRFYGEPAESIVRHERTVSGEEEQLVGVASFLELNREQVVAERQPDIDAALTRIRSQLQETRKKGLTALLRMVDAGSATSNYAVEAILEGGDAVAVDAVPADANPSGIRERWTGAEQAWSKYRASIEQIAANRDRAHALEKHELGRINSRLERTRLSVRRIEMESGLQLLPLDEELQNLEQQIADLERQRTENARYGRLAERWLAGDASVTAVKQLVEALNTDIDPQIAEAKSQIESARLRINQLPGSAQMVLAEFAEVNRSAREQTARIIQDIEQLRRENGRYDLVMKTADGQQQPIPLANVVRAFAPNQMSFGQKLSLYGSRWWEYLTAEPREANSEGGVFPAIWGTVVMTLVMSLAVAPFGVLAALYLREYAKAGAMVSAVRIAVNNLAGVPSIVFGVFGLGFFCYVIGASIDEAFFSASLPNPTFGKGGLLWASLTLAIMTLPVVIVATEEALAAVPNSMREGSYACGASKWQTIRRIVLPRAMPGIMTGMILAMARGAGEVAPLMLVGAVKLAPELPVDGVFPFVHPERSFMHLGFHIFDLGFQSQNSEAAKPMVFTTTLLLIVIIAVLNLTAIWLRGRLRRKFVSAQF